MLIRCQIESSAQKLCSICVNMKMNCSVLRVTVVGRTMRFNFRKTTLDACRAQNLSQLDDILSDRIWNSEVLIHDRFSIIR